MTGDRASGMMASQPDPTPQLLMGWKWRAVRPGTRDDGEGQGVVAVVAYDEENPKNELKRCQCLLSPR
jgi:hypothetical protein